MTEQTKCSEVCKDQYSLYGNILTKKEPIAILGFTCTSKLSHHKIMQDILWWRVEMYYMLCIYMKAAWVNTCCLLACSTLTLSFTEIGHFWVPLCLGFKQLPMNKTSLMKRTLICMKMNLQANLEPRSHSVLRWNVGDRGSRLLADRTHF